MEKQASAASSQQAPAEKKKTEPYQIKELEVQKPLADTQKTVVADSPKTVDTTAVDAAESVAALTAYGDSEDEGNTSLWSIFLSGLLGGSIAVVTPCVWPIIPMTVSFFLKRNTDKAKGRQQALLYGLSIIVIYVALGLL